MKSVPGSSALTEEQSDWYERHFGVRYHVVQEAPLRQSREVRRANRFGGRRRKLTGADIDAANRQHDIRQKLLADPIRARV